MTPIRIEGLKTVTAANTGGHWRKKADRVKKQRAAAMQHVALWRAHDLLDYPRPARVHLTRVANRSLDSDNLQSSLKAVRDGVADALGCDDSERAGIEWTYSQRKHEKPKSYAVEIEVFW
jgi:hypothetical protein